MICPNPGGIFVMTRFAALLIGTALVTGAVGCYDGAYRNRSNDPWWNDSGDRPNNDNGNAADDDCRRDRGRIDERKWRAIVDQFAQRTFRKQPGFRQAREDLMNDLRGVRDRACDWERSTVDRLLDRVRDFRYNSNDGSVS